MMVPLLLANASAADRHVVSTAEVHKAAVSATATREANAEKVDKLLSSPQAEAALEASGMDLSQVKNAVSTLDDAELAKLAARADQAQSDFAAGRLSDRDILWVVVGIAALILIIVAVR
ncbi:MAG: PA2779 family protein [Bryobacteraceae bacterium]